MILQKMRKWNKGEICSETLETLLTLAFDKRADQIKNPKNCFKVSRSRFMLRSQLSRILSCKPVFDDDTMPKTIRRVYSQINCAAITYITIISSLLSPFSLFVNVIFNH